MIFFNDPVVVDDPAVRAARMAQQMQQRTAVLAAGWKKRGYELQLGIGIHCGPAVVGHMGRGVATYLTAVGDTVNLASRLQDQTKRFACQLVVSAPAASRAGLDVSALRHEEIAVRNRDGAIAIHIVDDVLALENSMAPA